MPNCTTLVLTFYHSMLRWRKHYEANTYEGFIYNGLPEVVI